MSRNRDYQRMLNSRRWKELRLGYLQEHPLCERCEREGYVRAAVDVHHKQPVEQCKTVREMETYCFMRDNLEALCIPCHIKTHQEMRSHSRQEVKANRQRQLLRWVDRMEARPEGQSEENPGSG